jgi:hypothetical protein
MLIGIVVAPVSPTAVDFTAECEWLNWVASRPLPIGSFC